MKFIFFILFTFPLLSNETLSKEFWVKTTSESFYFFVPEVKNQKILFETYIPKLDYYLLIFIFAVFNLSLVYFLIKTIIENYSSSIKIAIFSFLLGLFCINPVIYLSYKDNIQKIEINQFSQKIILDEKISLPLSNLEKIYIQKVFGKTKTNKVRTTYYKIFILLNGIGELEIFTSKEEKISIQISTELAKTLGVELFHYEKKVLEKNNSYIPIDESFIQNLKPISLSIIKKENLKELRLGSIEKNLFFRNLLFGFLFIFVGISCLIPAIKFDAKAMIYLGGFFLLIGIAISCSIFYLKELKIEISKDLIYLERKYYGTSNHQISKKDILKILYSKNNLVIILKGGEKFLNSEFERMEITNLSGTISNIQDYFKYIREFNVDGLSLEDRLYLFYQIESNFDLQK